MSNLLRSARSPWLASPLIALACLASVWALQDSIAIGSWLITTALALGSVTAVIAMTRMVTRSRLLPSMAGLVASILVLIPLYAQDADARHFTFPTPDGVKALVATIQAGVDYALSSGVPATVNRTLGCLITATILAMFLLAEHIAVSWRAVASSGIVLILPWLPAVIAGNRVPAGAEMIALGAWIGAMTLSRRNAPVERGIAFGAASLATVASVVLASLAVPAAIGGTGWGAIPRINTPEGFNTDTRLNLEADLQTSLTTNSQAPVFVYVTSGKRPDAFRMYTLTDFDGSRWSRESVEPTSRSATSGLLWTEPVPDWNDSERTRIDINILGLIQGNLPIPTAPRTVEISGKWTYDNVRDEVIGDGETTQDVQYAVVADYEFHDSATLRANQKFLDANPRSDVTDPAYFDIPAALDLEAVRGLAEELTAGKNTRYDKALAIQTYLRNPSIFTYTTDVNPSAGDTVSEFLRSREGYCVHFASTMVMMLRSIGIPARLALGFLGGDYDGTNGYIVRNGDYHSWPEVFFPGHGWVRFEPTPSVQTGAPPTYADPIGTQVPVPREVLEGGGYPTGPQNVVPTDPGDGPLLPEDAAPSAPVWLFVSVGLVALAAATAFLVLWRRRKNDPSHTLSGPEAAWQRLADRLGTLAWPTSATPAEAKAHVVRGLTVKGGRPPSDEGVMALTSLSDAVSDHRYAPEGTAAEAIVLDTWVSAVVSEATLADATSRPVRGAARNAPRDGS